MAELEVPTAYVRVVGGEETDEKARERYWREHPDQDGCCVEIIRRAFVKQEIIDHLTKQWMGKKPQ
jgi:hypothetical protein